MPVESSPLVDDSVPDPAFSPRHMDRSVSPLQDFYTYAAGNWLRTNPVPPDKTRWGAFNELGERTFHLLHDILERARREPEGSSPGPRRQVGQFYASAMDTPRLESLRFGPLDSERSAIEQIGSTTELLRVLARLHASGIPGVFQSFVAPDEKDSQHYALYLYQGGLSLPTREYYLEDSFAKVRAAFQEHVARMFGLGGSGPEPAHADAATVVAIETELAKASRTQTELRDRVKNYNRRSNAELIAAWPELHFFDYLVHAGVNHLPFAVVGQPEFFTEVGRLVDGRPLSEWKTYLRWHLLHTSAPFLHENVEAEDFDFFHRQLLGQETPEPRWRRAAVVVDHALGEALGQLYVEERFPPSARRKMAEMVRFISETFRDRLARLDWMSEATRREALAKFDRFRPLIGHPEKFRDYSSVRVDPGDLLGNVRRAEAFEFRRQFDRIGGPVDRDEWGMTPPTVNAYYESTQNQIFFPAGILQPPFFDPSMDDAVNYGGIGGVISHEITHGFDDQGRRSDAEGNLRDWWTETDAREFQTRAQEIVRLYEIGEPLPGLHVNGALTLGENIADFGGVSIAFEALERDLAAHPEKRRIIDGLTPEQRFFVSWAQIWRSNIKDAELRRRLVLDPHAPARYRAVTPVMNFRPFHEAFASDPANPSSPREFVRIW